MIEKLKSLLRDDGFFLTLIILLVGVASFGLGRASVTPLPQPAGVIITDAPAPQLQIADQSQTVVVSRSGSRYHLPECPGVAQISPANRLEFDSIAAAEAAGYTPAANCPGL
ncbi:MAG: hypothetical protein ACOC4E_02310 [Patescibacteria group bacterium]